MRIGYDRQKNIMLVEISKRRIDYAEEAGPMIVHFSKDRAPVLLEILEASEFLSEATKATIRSKDEKFVSVSV